MNLIEVITTKENLNRAYKKVVENKGASGIDGVTVEELGRYIKLNKDEIVKVIEPKLIFKDMINKIYYVFFTLKIFIVVNNFKNVI